MPIEDDWKTQEALDAILASTQDYVRVGVQEGDTVHIQTSSGEFAEAVVRGVGPSRHSLTMIVIDSLVGQQVLPKPKLPPPGLKAAPRTRFNRNPLDD